MIKIKDSLKECGFTLSDFARDICISRPTLNTYIELFENCQSIPDEKYQGLFKRIFSGSFIDRNEVIKEIKLFHNTIKKEKLLGTSNLSNEKIEILNYIIEEMKKDMEEYDSNYNIYTFINVILQNYREDNSMTLLAKYYTTLYGYIKADDLTTHEEDFFSNYYGICSKSKKDLLETDTEMYEKFQKQSSNANRKNNTDNKYVKEKIEAAIQHRLNNLYSFGYSGRNISVEELLYNLEIDDE